MIGGGVGGGARGGGAASSAFGCVARRAGGPFPMWELATDVGPSPPPPYARFPSPTDLVKRLTNQPTNLPPSPALFGFVRGTCPGDPLPFLSQGDAVVVVAAVAGAAGLESCPASSLLPQLRQQLP